MKATWPTNPKKIEREIKKMMLLLRRVYNVIEMQHLNNRKLTPYYSELTNFPKSLGDDIYDLLKARDQDFIDIVIARQNRYLKRMKNKPTEQKNDSLEGIKIYQQSISNKLNSFTSMDQQLSSFHSINSNKNEVDMDYSKPKIGDLVYSDADVFVTSGSISRRYEVVGVYGDKIHFVNDTKYYTDIEEGYIDIKYLEPYEKFLEPFDVKIHYSGDCRYFNIPLETLRNNITGE